MMTRKSNKTRKTIVKRWIKERAATWPVSLKTNPWNQTCLSNHDWHASCSSQPHDFPLVTHVQTERDSAPSSVFPFSQDPGHRLQRRTAPHTQTHTTSTTTAAHNVWKVQKEPEIRYTCSLHQLYSLRHTPCLPREKRLQDVENFNTPTSCSQSAARAITVGVEERSGFRPRRVKVRGRQRESRTFHDTLSCEWLVGGSRKCHDFHILLGSVVTQIGALWPWQAQLYQQGGDLGCTAMGLITGERLRVRDVLHFAAALNRRDLLPRGRKNTQLS